MHAGLVERADDVGELLAAVRVEPDRGALRGAGNQLTEGPKQLDGAVAVCVVGGHHLDGRAADLGLEGVRCPGGDDLAVVDDPEVVGELVGLLEVLGGEEDGHPLVAGEMGDLVPERGPALDVEAGGRLVEEEDPRAVQQREGEVEPALHPAGVAADLPVGRVREADPLDQLVAALGALGLRHAVERALQAHVLAGGQVRVERGLLEGGADRVANGGALLDDVEAGDAGAPRGGREEGGEHVDRGRLAGAVRAEEAVDLTGPHLRGRCRRRRARRP